MPFTRELVPESVITSGRVTWITDATAPVALRIDADGASLATFAEVEPAPVFGHAQLMADGDGGFYAYGPDGLVAVDRGGRCRRLLDGVVLGAALLGPDLVAAVADGYDSRVVLLPDGQPLPSDIVTLDDYVRSVVASDNGAVHLLLSGRAPDWGPGGGVLMRLQTADGRTSESLRRVRGSRSSLIDVSGTTVLATDVSDGVSISTLGPDLTVASSVVLNGPGSTVFGGPELVVSHRADPRFGGGWIDDPTRIEGDPDDYLVAVVDTTDLSPTRVAHLPGRARSVSTAADGTIWLVVELLERPRWPLGGRLTLMWPPDAGTPPRHIAGIGTPDADPTLRVPMLGSPPMAGEFDRWAARCLAEVQHGLASCRNGSPAVEPVVVDITSVGAFPDAYVRVLARCPWLPATVGIALPIYDDDGYPLSPAYPWMAVEFGEAFDSAWVTALADATPDADGLVWRTPPRKIWRLSEP